MESIKPWWQSRAVWGGLVAVGAAVAAMFGTQIDPALQDELVRQILVAAGGLGGVLAVIGRLRAQSRIGRNPGAAGSNGGGSNGDGSNGNGAAGPGSNNGAAGSLALALAVPLAAALLLAACAVRTAETPAQKAFALYGTFVVAEEAAAALIADPALPAAVRQGIRTADAVAKPLADALMAAAREYARAAAELRALEGAGATAPSPLLAKAEVALTALLRAHDRAAPSIAAFADMINGLRKGGGP